MLPKTDPNTGSSWLRRSLEWTLLLAGVALLSRAGLDWHKYSSFQRAPVPMTLQASDANWNAGEKTDTARPRVLGRLTIARLRLSAVIVEGDGEDSLAVGIGHMPGTAVIGSAGNSVLAGHRDTAFWPLRNARVGDTIAVISDKEYRYRLVSIRIVDPEDIRAFANSDEAKLTLVSCYPFRHVGPAPQRIILTAELLDS